MMKLRRRLVAKAVSGLLGAFALVATARGDETAGGGSLDKMFNAVVKLEVGFTRSNPAMPWQNFSDSSDGSGVVIGAGRILTCAHCVAGATYIRIRKPCEDSIYKGVVEFVGDDSDLATVTVADPAFMRDITPMRIGASPDEQAHVLAVGYPLGGDGVSFTEGVVSRVEETTYAHSGKSLLAVQVDAAINPGNSGGPVFDIRTWTICGIAFQGNKRGEALGYLIPPDIIRHFLRDVEDGVVNGFCDFPFSIEHLESGAARTFYGMADGQTGIRVNHLGGGPVTNFLMVGDIILDVDGFKVANNGNIRIKGNRRRSWYYPLSMKQVEERVSVNVLRNGKTVRAEVPVRKVDACNRGFLYNRRPDYVVFGGFVFSTVSYDFLKRVKVRFHTDVYREKAFEGEQDVALVNVLPCDCVEGYLGCSGSLVRSVNGERVKNLKHLLEILENCHEEFLRFGLDIGNDWENVVVVKTAKMREATQQVLRNYQIPADRSSDL